ncbi:MAG: Vitamin B12 transporter BtuB [Gammaproteobacteria bacterium]|nr:Vitamin B12 transporter BtuB [Gammaproteobacteria bacterium]
MSILRPYGALTAMLAALAPHSSPLPAQESGTDETERLTDVTVTATRVEKSALKVPAAVSVVGQDEIQLGRQQLGLDESLNSVPGLFFQDRYNFAQDLRISIRGFGARSNFGIRGVRIYTDGVPATLPDGQGGIDDVDLGSTQRIEVLRGPSSSLYGVASGGVINIFTEDGPPIPFVQGRADYGSYGFQNFQLKGGGQYDNLNYLINGSHLYLGGFRDHSETENNVLNSKFRYDFDPTSNLTLTFNAIDSPLANDPGGLNAGEVATDRQIAAPNNLLFDAGEAVEQQRVGLVYRKDFGPKHSLTLRNYYVLRDFQNKLPSNPGAALTNNAWVEFDRFFLGGGGQYSYTDSFLGHRNRFTAGFDIDSQEDNRQRYTNLPGGIQGPLRFDQAENVNSRGFYLQNEFSILENLELTAGARYDVVEFDVEDDFLSDGDDSGDVDFDATSPMVGLLWSPIEEINLYGTVSTAFETPTTTEFANPANNGNAGGFNASLGPQTATNYEVGIKGLIAEKVRYELAVFTIDVSDEIVQFEIPGAPQGRSFFTNAADSTRDGLEAAVAWEVFPGLTLQGAYTYSDFEFDQFRSTQACGTPDGNCDGMQVPGVPRHQFHGQVSYYHPSGFYALFDMLHVGELYADNANTATNDAYHVANLRVGRDFQRGAWLFSPFLGINNFFNEEYNANVRLNAFGGRYFEPAPPHNVYGGITVRYDF